MDPDDVLARQIGRITLANTESDEWLVEALILMLRPLPARRVEILVAANSLDQKCKLIKKVAADLKISLDEPLGSGQSPQKILSRVMELNRERNRAVHSYYAHYGPDQILQFRSRQPKARVVPIADLKLLADGFIECNNSLEEFTNYLADQMDAQTSIDSLWDTVIRGSHEVIVAGHLHQRGILESLGRKVDGNDTIRLAIHETRRRLLEAGERPKATEFLVEINPVTWLASITAPSGKTVQIGDTGWRDVTVFAQEYDLSIKSALVRRIGSNILVRYDADKNLSSEQLHRLAKRAFGPESDEMTGAPLWLWELNGFRPSLPGRFIEDEADPTEH